MTEEKDAIYKQLSSVPDYAKKRITGGRLTGMTDVKPQWRIQRMTEVFGMCGVGWKYEVTKQWIVDVAKEEKIVFVNINLYTKAEEWSEPIPGSGGSMLTAQESKGLYNSDEAIKMATTDALSVAMKMIGVASDVYLGEDATKYIEGRAKELRTMRGHLNVPLLKCKNISEIDAVCKSFQKKYGKEIWVDSTNHNSDETFRSLAMVHRGRINDIIEFVVKVDSCDSGPDFLRLDKIFRIRDMFSSHQDVATAISNAGERLGMPGYAEQEPVPLADEKEPVLDLKGALVAIGKINNLLHLDNWHGKHKKEIMGWTLGPDQTIISNAYQQKKKELQLLYRKEQQLKHNS